jgi:electron transfer flavoprotein alpha subunit
MIRELAGLFERGAMGASRPLCDTGWLPLECQVGMTGQTVSPKLYIACGISGAVQHTMGMKNSSLIVAINTDRNALFCKVAHYCVIADLNKFIPVVIEKIRRYLTA